MKAMILAAGKGTRVQPLTLTTPKPMLLILDIPVMETIILRLRQHGFNDIVINTSYLSESIEAYFGDGKKWNVNISYSFEGQIIDGKRQGKSVGSAGGMKKIQNEKSFFDDTFLVICGDAIVDIDFTKAVESHRQRKALSSIILKDVDINDVSKYGVVELDSTQKIVSFQEKPAIKDAKSTLVNTGIYLFEPEIFDHIPDDIDYDIGGELFPKLVEYGSPLYGIKLPFQWIDIGTIKDYYNANTMALNGEINDFTYSNKGLIFNQKSTNDKDIEMEYVNLEINKNKRVG